MIKEIDELVAGTIQERAVAVALRYGGIDGDHHKQWVIDQMLRILLGSEYDAMIKHGRNGEYPWEVGIAP